MKFRTDRHYLTAAWLWILGFTLFRIVYARLFLLAPDECNYWQWSRYLDWGYYDQAPMIAWVIKLSTLLFGHTHIGVRLPSIFAIAVASAYLVAMTSRWLGARTAFAVAVLTQGILEFNVGGLMATCDGIQAAAWAGAAYHVARGYEGGTWRQWLMGGLWFGFGLLSKYTMVLFLPSAFLYGLFSSRHRYRLATIRPYAGVLLGCLMFLPVIWWNAVNGWNSVRHVAYIGGANEGFKIHLKYLGDLLGSQAALLSPLVFILVLWAWHRVFWKKYNTDEPFLKQFPDTQMRDSMTQGSAETGYFEIGRDTWIFSYLFYTSFFMFAFFSLLSLHTRIYGNWPAAAFLTGSVLVAAFFRGRKIWTWSIAVAYLFSALVLVQVVWPVLPIPASMDRTAYELSGWDELGKAVESARKEMPRPENTFIFGLRYQIASELAFYVPGNPRTVSINRWNRPNVYDFWWKDEDLAGMDAVGVVREKSDYETRLTRIFERVDPPEALAIYRRRSFSREKEIVKTYYLFRAYGFKGGIHWLPPSESDIRVSIR